MRAPRLHSLAPAVLAVLLALVLADGTAHAAPAKRKHAAKRHPARHAAKPPGHPARTRAQGEFERLTGWPEGRPGYEIEYIKPLRAGGTDDPGNMRWKKVKGKGGRRGG